MFSPIEEACGVVFLRGVGHETPAELSKNVSSVCCEAESLGRNLDSAGGSKADTTIVALVKEEVSLWFCQSSCPRPLGMLTPVPRAGPLRIPVSRGVSPLGTASCRA